MRIQRFFPLVVLTLSACAGPAPTAEVSPSPTSSAMRIAARIPAANPRVVDVARGALWVLQGDDTNPDDPHRESVLRVDPASNSIIAAIEKHEHSIGGGWQLADTADGLWIATPDGVSAPDFGPGNEPIPTDIRTVFRAGRPIKADLNAEDVSGGLVLIDPSTNTLRRVVIFLDWSLDSIASTSAGLWVTSLGDKGSRLSLFDPNKGATRSIQSDHYFHLHAGPGSLWACGEKGVERLNPETGEVQTRLAISASDCAVTSNAVWVATGEDLVRVDPSSGHIVARIPVTTGADEVTADNDDVVALTWRPLALVHIDPASNALDSTMDLENSDDNANRVSALAIGFGSAWVINGDVVRVDLPAG